MKSKFIFVLCCIVLCIAIAAAVTIRFSTHQTTTPQIAQLQPIPASAQPVASPAATIPTPTPIPVPTPTPTASPSGTPTLTLADATKLYGPCAVVPTLMYHHIQDLGLAKAAGHDKLTVGTPYFRKQMQYLRDHNYSVITMQSLINFFNGSALPPKPILLTFDDGYDDFGSDAAPILQEFHFPGTMFTATGLVENPGYLTWSKIKELSGTNLILFSNHTWSHHGLAASSQVIDKEVSLAMTQLHERGYDVPKVLAYPYGSYNQTAEKMIADKGYSLAFTTNKGRILCKGQRYELPRVRIGNAPLSFYGL